MQKLKKLVAIVLLLMLMVTGVALADDALVMEGTGVDPDHGYLNLTVKAQNTDAIDPAHFTASTENGALDVLSADQMRKNGVTWFVIVDYDNGKRLGGEYLTQVEDWALQRFRTNAVQDNDNGAVIKTSSSPSIAVVSRDQFLNDLTNADTQADGKELGTTLRKVMEYIDANQGSLKDHAAVLIMTSAQDADKAIQASIQETLEQYGSITTYIMAFTGSRGNYNSNPDGWRDRAAKVAGLATLTLGGQGGMTQSLSQRDTYDLVDDVIEAERVLVSLTLDPKSVTNVGKEVSLRQTTADGKVISADATLPESIYDSWYSWWAVDTPFKQIMERQAVVVLNPHVDNAITATNQDIQLELIIAIALGVVILALIIVLIVVSRKKKKMPKTTTVNTFRTIPSNMPQVVVPRTPSTRIVLIAENGPTLSGEMVNGRLTFGRSKAKGARLELSSDVKLSGLHATFTKQGNSIVLTDNQSLNGTKINGKKISGSVVLSFNDRITMG